MDLIYINIKFCFVLCRPGSPVLSTQFHLIPTGVKLQRALMVQPTWASLLITGQKTLELRNYHCRNVKVGDEVDLIACGQGPCGLFFQ